MSLSKKKKLKILLKYFEDNNVNVKRGFGFHHLSGIITCNLCGKKSPYIYRLKNCSNGEYLHDFRICEDCVREIFVVCMKCTTAFPRSMIITKSINSATYHYCKRCFSKMNFVVCDNCSKEMPSNYINKVDNKNLCDNCYRKLYTECRWCHKRLLKKLARKEKYNINYPYEYFHKDCYKKMRKSLNYYEYKPPPKFKKTRFENTKLFFGIELEIEANETYTCLSSGEIVDEIKDFPSWLYFKNDSSIDYGLEIVSEPMSWRYLTQPRIYKNWDKVFKKLKKRHFYSYKTCGMHVHMSLSAFTTCQLFKFLHLFYNNPEFTYIISGRPNVSDLSHQASYNHPEDSPPKRKAKNKGNRERHVLINVTGDTVECRFFASTLDIDTFFANLECLKAAYDYAINISLKSMRQKDNKYLSDFCQFVLDNRKSYRRFATLVEAKWVNNKKKIKFPKKKKKIVPDYASIHMEVHEIPIPIQSPARTSDGEIRETDCQHMWQELTGQPITYDPCDLIDDLSDDGEEICV